MCSRVSEVLPKLFSDLSLLLFSGFQCVSVQVVIGSFLDCAIGLSQLYQIRSSNDRNGPNDFKYGIIGVDTTVNSWNQFGIYEGLMTHQWRDELERLMILPRGEGNKLLADKADRQARAKMASRFA